MASSICVTRELFADGCERPPEVEDRAVPGHWEGDLLSGARNTHIATLVEHSSRFVILVRVRGKDTESVVGAEWTHSVYLVLKGENPCTTKESRS